MRSHCVVVCVCLAASLALAGDLTPPPGPVVPTMLTLDEVEPRIAINATNTPGGAGTVYRIENPGSYYLTENLLGEAGKGGINIRASGVTIDLNGFALLGVAGSTDGIFLGFSNLQNITVRNGSIEKFGERGIDFTNSAGVGLSIVGVHASQNVGDGFAWNSGATVEGCTAARNTGYGFNFQSGGSAVRGCVASGNTLAGFIAGPGSSLDACVSSGNTQEGIFTGDSCTLSGCAARGNGTVGFRVNNGCALNACSAANNGTDGFSLDPGSTAEGCSATSNARGFLADTGTLLTGCNATDNAGNGIETQIKAAVIDCTAVANAIGIFARENTTVEGCTVSFNGSHGIDAFNGCAIIGNTCTMNAMGAMGAGINGRSGSVIDGNRVIGNRVGILTDGGGTIVSRNFARGNTGSDYDLDGQDDIGPIGTAKVSTSPWANISQ